jgi:hypothetical protein
VKVDDDDLLSGRICFFSLFLRSSFCADGICFCFLPPIFF